MNAANDNMFRSKGRDAIFVCFVTIVGIALIVATLHNWSMNRDREKMQGIVRDHYQCVRIQFADPTCRWNEDRYNELPEDMK